ncbi:nucleolar protein 9 isoform X2 [Bacillus rossius redtenbacheri]|uniref:nucleolar protein 9 isoform X2 n=1 Tax=Bacillus rossius redtenbacheri TaxID=93214 RepID=UPI002FDCB256
MDNTQPAMYNRNKKRKSSFLVMAKKFAKKGKFGKGSQIDEEKYHYFLRVRETNKAENFQTDGERGLFANNVLVETEGKEVEYSSNQLASRVIEELLDWASGDALSRYMRVFGEDLRPVFCDQFASHVLQKLIVIAATGGTRGGKAGGGEVPGKAAHREWLLKVARYALNNLEEFVRDTHANQVTRAVLECLAGMTPRSTADARAVPESVDVPPAHRELLEEFGRRVEAWPRLPEMVYTDLTAGFVQTLLLALKVKKRKLAHSLVRKLLDECLAVPEPGDDAKGPGDAKDGPPLEPQRLPVFASSSASRVLDVAIMVASSKLRTQIYARCFINNMLPLSKLPYSNFCIQRLLNCHKVKEEVEAMYDELGPNLGQLLGSGKTGVVLSLGQACQRLETRQGSFMQHLAEALQCKNKQEFVPLVLQLSPAAKWEDTPPVHLHGSLLVQTMLRFNKPISVVSGLLAMAPARLRDVLSDPKGCHITDVFVSSEYVGAKSREKLVVALELT